MFRWAKQIDLRTLGVEFGRLTSRGGAGLWRWAQALLQFYEAQRASGPPDGGRLTLAAVGEAVGLAARGQAFSKAWVSRALSAARAWPQMPRTAEERAAFALAFHGHQPKAQKAGADQVGLRLRRVLERLRRAAAEAVALGCAAGAVVAFIAAALRSAAEAADPVRAVLPPGLPRATWAPVTDPHDIDNSTPGRELLCVPSMPQRHDLQSGCLGDRERLLASTLSGDLTCTCE